MFHKDAGQRQTQRGNAYLDVLDQSPRLQLSEAILMGYVEDVNGPSPQVNANPAAACKLDPFRPALSGTMRQTTIVRILIPLPVIGRPALAAGLPE